MEASDKVTSYIESFADWRGMQLELLRNTIKAAGPELKEDFKWGVPVWSFNGLVLAVSAFKDHVKINFFKGIYLPDQSHFNSGLESKEHRSINYQQQDSIDTAVITQLVRSAIGHNTQ